MTIYDEHGRKVTARVSHAMHNALGLIAQGYSVKDAALSAQVTAQALYRALQRINGPDVRPRCGTCGQVLRGQRSCQSAGGSSSA